MLLILTGCMSTVTLDKHPSTSLIATTSYSKEIAEFSFTSNISDLYVAAGKEVFFNEAFQSQLKEFFEYKYPTISHNEQPHYKAIITLDSLDLKQREEQSATELFIGGSTLISDAKLNGSLRIEKNGVVVLEQKIFVVVEKSIKSDSLNVLEAMVGTHRHPSSLNDSVTAAKLVLDEVISNSLIRISTALDETVK